MARDYIEMQSLLENPMLMRKTLPYLLGLALLAPSAQAANEARWFRYVDDRGQPVVSDIVTPEHVARGYEELSSRMQVLRKVAAQRPLTEAERAAQKGQREAEAQRARSDKQLLRLYAGPADAERARNRQLDALQVRIDFSTNALAAARQRRTVEAQRAATFERQGKPVPADVKKSVADIDRQIAAAQTELKARQAEQASVRAEFDAMIQRLAELTGKPAGTVPPSGDTSAPGQP